MCSRVFNERILLFVFSKVMDLKSFEVSPQLYSQILFIFGKSTHSVDCHFTLHQSFFKSSYLETNAQQGLAEWIT